MDNTFTFEADFPTGTKVLVYDGEDAAGNMRTFAHTLRRTTHLMPPNYYLGRRIVGFDLSQIFDNNERARIENERILAWQDQALRRINDNNNVDPVAVPARMDDNAIPAGRAFRVPSGGRKSRRGGTPFMWRKLFQSKRRARERADKARTAQERATANAELDRATNDLRREESNMTSRGEPVPDERSVRLDIGGGKSRRGRKSKKYKKRRVRKTNRRR